MGRAAQRGGPARWLTTEGPSPSFGSPALIVRASVFRAWLELLTPPSRSALRDTGFPASASSLATRSAISFCECAGSETGRLVPAVAAGLRSAAGPPVPGGRPVRGWSWSRPRGPAGPRAGPRGAGPRTARWLVLGTGCPAGFPRWRRHAACGLARSPCREPGPAGRTRRW
jgi:hypothetical protein